MTKSSQEIFEAIQKSVEAKQPNKKQKKSKEGEENDSVQYFTQFIEAMKNIEQPKKERKKRIISEEQKQKLIENLKKGRVNSLQTRKTKAEVRKNPPAPKPSKEDERFNNLMSQIGDLTTALKNKEKEKEEEDFIAPLPPTQQATQQPTQQATQQPTQQATQQPTQQQQPTQISIQAPQAKPIFFSNKFKRSVF
jgi:hypothetical protein